MDKSKKKASEHAAVSLSLSRWSGLYSCACMQVYLRSYCHEREPGKGVANDSLYFKSHDRLKLGLSVSLCAVGKVNELNRVVSTFADLLLKLRQSFG